MSNNVFVVSEWQPKEGCEESLWQSFKELVATTKAKEKGCIRAHATKQITHPGAPHQSKFKIVLLQEYQDVAAFDAHCASEHVANAFKELMSDPDTSPIADWQCRLFREDE